MRRPLIHGSPPVIGPDQDRTGIQSTPPLPTRGWPRQPAGRGGQGRRQAMIGSRVALVAEDQRMVSNIQTTLKKGVNQVAFHCKFDAIRNHIGRDTDGVLIVGLTDPAEVEPLLRLLQEASIQNLEMSVVVVT